MIADCLEAAARSLDDFTEEAVTHLVERLVAEKAEDGQFNDCQLTFEELKIVKKTLIKTLVASSHSRIKYPKKILRNA
jgi:membrane-associated HD superfamily phosphohydrolase